MILRRTTDFGGAPTAYASAFDDDILTSIRNLGGVSSVADDNEDQGLHSLTTEIVASFVGNNPVAIGDLPAVIASVFGTLRSVTQVEAEKPAEAPVPAVPIKKSIGTDFLVCLEDGQKVKVLKRYLASRYNLTPDQYRQRWDLPKTYPMVAPAYGRSVQPWPGRSA